MQPERKIHNRFRWTAALLCLAAVPALAEETDADVQAQYVAAVTRAATDMTNARTKFTAGDYAGGCVDLTAASADESQALSLLDDLIARIRGHSEFTPDVQASLQSQANDQRATHVKLRQDEDAQIERLCSAPVTAGPTQDQRDAAEARKVAERQTLIDRFNADASAAKAAADSIADAQSYHSKSDACRYSSTARSAITDGLAALDALSQNLSSDPFMDANDRDTQLRDVETNMAVLRHWREAAMDVWQNNC